MRNLFRVTTQSNPTGPMVSFLGQQDSFQEMEPGIAKIDIADMRFPSLKALTLGAMTICGSVRLITSTVWRIAPQESLAISTGNIRDKAFVILFQAGPGTMLTAGDEAVKVLTGEEWVVDANQPSQLINKSEDEVFMLVVVMDPD